MARRSHPIGRVRRSGGGKQKWMQKLDLKKGALRKELKVKTGYKIPLSKLKKAAHSSNPKLKKRAVLALTFRRSSKRR